jgi:hypothetical protein
MELITVASSGNVMMTNAAVSPEGRLFGNFPRWTDVPAPSVGEATADSKFKPFPGGAWNEWRPGVPPGDRFVCTHGLYADRDNNLWVIDDASPHHGPMIEGGAKLVQIDLATNRVSRVYALGKDLAPPGAVLSHMRVDARFLYVTDSGFGVIVVIDRQTGRGHRVLEGAPCSRADRTITPMSGGRPGGGGSGARGRIHDPLSRGLGLSSREMADRRRHEVRCEPLPDVAQGRIGDERDLLDVSVMVPYEAEVRRHGSKTCPSPETCRSR